MNEFDDNYLRIHCRNCYKEVRATDPSPSCLCDNFEEAALTSRIRPINEYACNFCKENIKIDATICPYCVSRIPTGIINAEIKKYEARKIEDLEYERLSAEKLYNRLQEHSERQTLEMIVFGAIFFYIIYWIWTAFRH
ncbi:MAG: hypothetical protein RI902_1826 [Pseudomonadota bacterium]|jgi:hypothetical protein